jgi:hypothetical protein
MGNYPFIVFGDMAKYRDGRELKEGQTILVIGFNVPRADQT